MKKQAFEYARDFFNGQAKIASVNEISKNDLIEVGMVGSEIDKFDKVAHYISQEVLYKIAEGMNEIAMTASNSQGKTPLQEEQGDKSKPDTGMAVPTDHGKKDEFSAAESAAMKKVNELTAVNSLEGPSGEGEGKVLSHTNVVAPTQTESNGAKAVAEKGASDRVNKVLQSLLS